MNDSRNDFLPYIATIDGRLTDLAYELLEFVGRKKATIHIASCVGLQYVTPKNLRAKRKAITVVKQDAGFAKGVFLTFPQLIIGASLMWLKNSALCQPASIAFILSKATC